MKRFHSGLFGFAVILCTALMLTAFAKNSEAEPRKVIIVNVEKQILYAVTDYKIVYEFDVVTGRGGKETTTGGFTIFKKIEDYTSKTYNAPMPYTMFFTEDGKAIHGTKWATVRSYLHAYLTESVGSMGCVGQTEEHAKTLFEWAPVGTKVAIIDEEEERDN